MRRSPLAHCRTGGLCGEGGGYEKGVGGEEYENYFLLGRT